MTTRLQQRSVYERVGQSQPNAQSVSRRPAVLVLAVLALVVLSWLGQAGVAWAQKVESATKSGVTPRASGGAAAPAVALHSVLAHSHVIVPQARAFHTGRQKDVKITQVKVGVVVVEQVATSTLQIHLQNPNAVQAEARLLVPVPAEAAVGGLDFQGSASEPTAELLPLEEARRTYQEIVRRTKDPALLEFAEYNLIRTSVFPVPARGSQIVRLTYEHLLAADGDRVDYVLPRSESLGYQVPWEISLRIKSRQPISTVYSPSHPIETVKVASGIASVRLQAGGRLQAGPFRVSYLKQTQGVSASLLAYPDPSTGGGYFLLLAAAPKAQGSAGQGRIKREVTLVIDRSGSMAGEKLDQAREAARQIIEALHPGEWFNVIDYSHTVNRFASRPVVKTLKTLNRVRNYLKQLRASGGTNIHDALVEALRQPTEVGTLPLVLFLTDGLPTVGQTSEAAIGQLATQANPHDRRVFTFGVGVDVNAPLLEKIALQTRATSTFVLPQEDVEVKVAGVFARLSGPVLASPTLAVSGPDGAEGRVADLQPAQLPDLFAGDQLVLLGRYLGEEPLKFAIGGNYHGKTRQFEFEFSLEKATTKNGFVPRLWASRQIAVLSDAIRQLGADRPTADQMEKDPRLKELVEEVVRLSKEFGVLTEYTAFLSKEGTDLTRYNDILAEANRNFYSRAITSRVGLGAVNQSYNFKAQRKQCVLNPRNEFYNAQMQRVAVASIQQVNDLALYRRGNGWIDSRLVDRLKPTDSVPEVAFGSPEFDRIVKKLASQGRQGCIALEGEIVLEIDGQPVVITTPSQAKD